LDFSTVRAGAAKRSTATGMYQLQRIRLQNALNLIACMHGPRPRGIELDVRLPVFQRLAGLAGFFVGKREVVVRVGL
jgi:hypothetical protein